MFDSIAAAPNLESIMSGSGLKLSLTRGSYLAPKKVHKLFDFSSDKWLETRALCREVWLNCLTSGGNIKIQTSKKRIQFMASG